MRREAREALDAILSDARRGVAMRQQAIQAASDRALAAVLGIRDPALCRRVAATPRVARRIADGLARFVVADEEQSLGALLAEDLPTDPDAVRLIDEEARTDNRDGAAPAGSAAMPPDCERLVRMLAAAICLSSSGALLARGEIDGVLALHGQEAVDFALQHRGFVPEWMRLASGDRQDVHLQLAASCIASLAQDMDAAIRETAMRDLDPYEPLPLGEGEPRDGARRLAASAVAFIAETDARSADGSGERT